MHLTQLLLECSERIFFNESNTKNIYSNIPSKGRQKKHILDFFFLQIYSQLRAVLLHIEDHYRPVTFTSHSCMSALPFTVTMSQVKTVMADETLKTFIYILKDILDVLSVKMALVQN